MENPFHGIDWGRALGDLSEAIVTGRPHRATGAQAAHVVEILDAITLSVAEGRAVEITSSFVRPSSARTAPVQKIARVEARELGRSGVSVTRIVLGCGNFGGVGSSPAFFGQGIRARRRSRIMDAAWELGIRAFDTADAYGGGRSETWIGEWLASMGPDVRDAITIETKTFNPMAEGADRGLSRARLRRQVETSLERLGLERIPLYTAHDFDPDTPQEETIRAFDELVTEGKVGAVGASNFTAEQLAEAVEIAELEGLTRYEWVQNSYSLLDSGNEETVFPFCREHGLGFEAFGPLAGGWLAGRYRRTRSTPRGPA